MNYSAFNKNYRANREQAAKGDMTMLDRADQEDEKTRNKEIMQTLFRPSYSHGVDWQCSLRQYENDTEYDGVPILKDPTALEGIKIQESPEKFDAEPASHRDYLSQLSMMASRN